MAGTHTRRRLLRLTGAAAAGVLGASGTAAAQGSGWTQAESPVCTQWNGAVHAGDGAYVAGENGYVISRASGSWEVVVDSGPQGENSDLLGIDATDDGARVWFAGASGAIGEYDVATGSLTDHSAPQDVTSTWKDIDVEGTAEGARVYLVNGSGQELSGTRGPGGTVQWESPTTPGSGSALNGADFYDFRGGMLASSNGAVFETTDGNSYSKVGVEDAQVTFYDVAAAGGDDANVSAGSGKIFHYDGTSWKRLGVGQNDLYGIDRRDDAGLAVGGGGVVFERQATEQWTTVETPTGNTLRGVAVGDQSVDVAVGDGGTILERSE